MPYSRRTGRRYAAGSQTVFDGYPKVCAAGEGCRFGGRIVMGGDLALWFEQEPGGEPRSWHFACRPRTEAARAD